MFFFILRWYEYTFSANLTAFSFLKMDSTCIKIYFLQAIYGGQLREASRANNDWQPLDVVLTLSPQQGSVLQEAHATVDLHIICSDKYPYE